jgi:hypothetical protein
MVNYQKKNYISQPIKNAVWKRDSVYPLNNEITQCRTCMNLVMIPESIRKINNIPYDIRPIYINGRHKVISGVAEFGHIISEKNGGKITEDNLIIQCKICNVRQGSKNIDKKNLVHDYEMIDADTNVDKTIEMGEYSGVCHGKCSTGMNCKNRPLFNREYCHIHLIK